MKVLLLFLLLSQSLLSQAPIGNIGRLFSIDNETSKEHAQPLLGAWMRSDGDQTVLQSFYGGVINTSHVNKSNNIIGSHAIGRYRINEKGLLERPFYTTENWKWLKDKIFVIKVTYETENILVKGHPDGGKTIWSRVSGAPDGGSLDQVSDFSSEVTDVDGIWFREDSAGKRGEIRFCELVIFDRGRFSVTHFNYGEDVVTKHKFGIYSFKDGLLTSKASAATEAWKDAIASVSIARVTSIRDGIMLLNNLHGSSWSWQRLTTGD